MHKFASLYIYIYIILTQSLIIIDNIVPDKWKHSIILSIQKKGNSSSLENQRGIAKSCAFAKLTNKLLLARIRDIIEPQLLGVQSGF